MRHMRVVRVSFKESWFRRITAHYKVLYIFTRD